MPFGGSRRGIGFQSSAEAGRTVARQATRDRARSFGNTAGVIERVMRGIMVGGGAPHNRPAARAGHRPKFRDDRRQFPGLCATDWLRDSLKTGRRYLQTREEQRK